MFLSSVLIHSLPLLSCASGASTTYADPGVPRGTPIPGDYSGPLRPQVHYSPPKNFMNDPNGMFVDEQGIWHLYYQYNPLTDVGGNQHWGHATSKDLYHWINQPIAIYPVNSTSYIYSGSAVVDVNNTSGFFPDQTNGVVAIYTTAQYTPVELQTQCLSYSKDGGYTFIPYEGNPVLNLGSPQFRDPKVVRYNEHWVMVVSFAVEFTIGIFTSQDLKYWKHASNFTHAGLLGVQYECPNLVEMPLEGGTGTMWVLQISINPGAPLGGSIAQSFIGDFDGFTFTPMDKVTRINDFAKDNYAGQFFYGTSASSEVVSIAWASNWQYTQDVPTGNAEGWRGAMTLPRQQSIRNAYRTGWSVVSKPFNLAPIIGEKLASSSNLINSSIAVDYSMVRSNALYLVVNVTDIPSANVSSYASMNFSFMSPVSGEYLQGGYFFGNNYDFWLNRGGIVGYDNIFFTDKFSTSDPVQGSWSFEAVIDRSILEIFGDDGLHSGTALFYPEQPLTLLTLSTGALPPKMKVSAAIFALESAWAKYENEDGIVVGNVTKAGGSYRVHERVVYEAEF